MEFGQSVVFFFFLFLMFASHSQNAYKCNPGRLNGYNPLAAPPTTMSVHVVFNLKKIIVIVQEIYEVLNAPLSSETVM